MTTGCNGCSDFDKACVEVLECRTPVEKEVPFNFCLDSMRAGVEGSYSKVPKIKSVGDIEDWLYTRTPPTQGKVTLGILAERVADGFNLDVEEVLEVLINGVKGDNV